MDYIVKAYKDWKLHSQFQEIVPDMDDEFMMFNEKQSIRESARSLKKYGSTCCNHSIRNNETLIRHEIEKTDTLQGIALKYGCTTEQIRRANRLFASDSLFLRQYLLVPVEKSSPYYPKINENDSTVMEISSSSSSSSSTTESTTATITAATTITVAATNEAATSAAGVCINDMANASSNNPRPSTLPTRPYSIAGELLTQTNDDDSTLMNNHHHNSNIGGGNGSQSNKQSKSLDSVVAMTPEEENRKCINEFLNKIDTTISESRKYVEKSKEMITSQSDNDLFVTTDFVVQHRRNNHLNNSYKNQQHQRQNHQSNHMRQSSSGSNSDTAQLLNTTQTRHVQKRLEKQQDEFFEL